MYAEKIKLYSAIIYTFDAYILKKFLQIWKKIM